MVRSIALSNRKILILSNSQLSMADSSPFQFTGSIPQHYDDHLGPMFFEPYAQDVGKLIGTSTINDALEIACGTGRVTRHLRNALPSTSRLIASDMSEDMLTVAQNKLAGLNIEWKIVDAQNLPFHDNSFDLVVCYFGYMFAPDKDKAFAEAFRVLRKGGRLLMATWDKLESSGISNVFRTTLKHYLGDTLPETYKAPYSMHDPELIISMLKNAGFSNVESQKVARNATAESASKAAYGVVNGGTLYNEISKREPRLIERISTDVEKGLAEKYGKAPMVAPMIAIITNAIK